ncbi:hypothetical protein ECE50_024165 [Chitinophaga sp. Mgbs1]|uniref:FecR family protein n=1 Tax=Chitinophaga solisilvae TaxID=1233460 RepID=A0A9Q5DA70_9BACT|nr:hypothetical protein [Chitinophaga solisilvae]
MKKNYHLFTKDDFLEDAFFLEWRKYATPEAAAFWTTYHHGAPGNLAALEQAIAAMDAILSLERIRPATADKALVWQQIQAELTAVPVIPVRQHSGKRWLAAAVLIPLFILTAWYLLLPPRMHKVRSGYGQQVRVVLPDSSVVVLNSHSELQYPRWKDGKREVWLQGEALFDVRPVNIATVPHFTVHAGLVNVEVLGTVFNVKQRRGSTIVFLKQGKVKVSAPQQQPLILVPDQKAAWSEEKKQLLKSLSSKTSELAWTVHKMQLKQTSVQDIIYTLQDTYGFTIILQDTSIASRTIEGTLSLKNVNNVLFELSAILNVKIEKNNDTLIFRDNGQRGY